MPELYPEDKKRVEAYLNASIHQVERKPFSPFKLLLALIGILVVLSAVSYWIALGYGVL